MPKILELFIDFEKPKFFRILYNAIWRSILDYITVYYFFTQEDSDEENDSKVDKSMQLTLSCLFILSTMWCFVKPLTESRKASIESIKRERRKKRAKTASEVQNTVLFCVEKELQSCLHL